ncbi:hypothetical protein B5F40_11785 [Gordonibacter sp. An230]|nr:hypothetical protein B5F40_11785 [Gordonibacter sp. An230]
MKKGVLACVRKEGGGVRRFRVVGDEAGASRVRVPLKRELRDPVFIRRQDGEIGRWAFRCAEGRRAKENLVRATKTSMRFATAVLY